MPGIGDTKISKAQDPQCCTDTNKQPITTQHGKDNGRNVHRPHWCTRSSSGLWHQEEEEIYLKMDIGGLPKQMWQEKNPVFESLDLKKQNTFWG